MDNSPQRLACISIDLDGLPLYVALHGLTRESLAPGGEDAVARLAPTRLAELLDELGCFGTFFAIGRDLREGQGSALRQLANAGHEIGNHTLSHPYALTRLPEDEQRREITEGARVIEEACGQRPVGFRAPGYTLSAELLRAAEESGHHYDSSVFPAIPYYFAKAAVLGSLALRGRPSAAVLDRPRVLAAPQLPYHPSSIEPYRRGEMLICELPITTAPWTRLPFIGTALTSLPRRLLRPFYLSLRQLPFLNLELHGIDLLDASDGAEKELAEAQRDLRIPAREKLSRLREMLGWLSDDYPLVTLRKAAEAFAPSL